MRAPIFDYFHNSPQPDERRSGLVVEAAGHFLIYDHAIRDRLRDDHLLLYCAAGGGYMTVGTRHRPLAAGDLAVTPPGVPHSYGCDPHTGWEVWYVHVSGPQARRLIRLNGFSTARFALTAPGDMVVPRMERIAGLLQRRPRHFGLDASGEATGLLLDLRKASRDADLAHSGIAPALEEEPTSVDEMAALAAMSRYHFIRRFRRATGTTPWRYIIERRMAEAKQLLADPELSVAAIAWRVGYRDPNYFSRAFRKETGLSPREYRQRHAP